VYWLSAYSLDSLSRAIGQAGHFYAQSSILLDLKSLRLIACFIAFLCMHLRVATQVMTTVITQVALWD
jgi:hypothetical protein